MRESESERERERMMNILGLGLVLSSLVTAGVWSPSPSPAKHNSVGDQDVIVKEGHRVVVVEYEKETHGSTKVSISPPEKTQLPYKRPHPEVVDEKEKEVKESSSVLPNKDQSVGQSPRELVCDALGKCKHKIAVVVGKAKEKVSETVGEGTEKAHEVEERAKEAVSEAKDSVVGKSKEIGGDLRRKAEEKADKVEKRAKDSVESEAIGKAKECVSDKAKTIGEKWKELGREVQRNVSRAMEPTLGVAHLLGFSTAYGACGWVTFVSSYVLAGALPRQQFGMVQSKIYPVYFRTLAYSVLVALAGHLFGQRKRSLLNGVDVVQAYNLLASLLMVLFNLLYLEPRATKVMFERLKVEKDEGGRREKYMSEPSSRAARDDPANIEPPAAPDAGLGTTTRSPEKDVAGKSQIVVLGEKLKELNGYSSFFNVLTLMALTWHLVYLAQNLHGTC